MCNSVFTSPLKSIKWLLIMVAVISIVSIMVAPVFAFANVYIGSYSAGNLSNSTWGPNFGGIFADVKYPPAASPQNAEAANNNIIWTSGQLSQITSAGFASAGPVFHVFDTGTGNCAAPFNWTGYYEVKPGTGFSIIGKNATCWTGQNSSYYNEVRVLYPRTSLVAGILYWGGATFQNGTNVLGLRHVSNDIYYMTGSNPAQRITILNRTWCFSTGGAIWLLKKLRS